MRYEARGEDGPGAVRCLHLSYTATRDCVELVVHVPYFILNEARLPLDIHWAHITHHDPGTASTRYEAARNEGGGATAARPIFLAEVPEGGRVTIALAGEPSSAQQMSPSELTQVDDDFVLTLTLTPNPSLNANPDPGRLRHCELP